MSKREPRRSRREGRLGVVAQMAREGSLYEVAASSLQMDAETRDRAIRTVEGLSNSGDEHDAIEAAAFLLRCAELLEALGHSLFRGTPIDELRAEIARMYGEALLIEVAGLGEPADVAAVRIRYIM